MESGPGWNSWLTLLVLIVRAIHCHPGLGNDRIGIAVASGGSGTMNHGRRIRRNSSEDFLHTRGCDSLLASLRCRRSADGTSSSMPTVPRLCYSYSGLLGLPETRTCGRAEFGHLLLAYGVDRSGISSGALVERGSSRIQALLALVGVLSVAHVFLVGRNSL